MKQGQNVSFLSAPLVPAVERMGCAAQACCPAVPPMHLEQRPLAAVLLASGHPWAPAMASPTALGKHKSHDCQSIHHFRSMPMLFAPGGCTPASRELGSPRGAASHSRWRSKTARISHFSSFFSFFFFRFDYRFHIANLATLFRNRRISRLPNLSSAEIHCALTTWQTPETAQWVLFIVIMEKKKKNHHPINTLLFVVTAGKCKCLCRSGLAGTPIIIL